MISDFQFELRFNLLDILTYTTHSLADPSGETIKKKEMATGELTLAADLRVVLKKRQVIDAKKGSKAQANKKQKELEHQQKMAHSLDSEHLKAQYHAETGVLIAEAMLPLDQNIIKEWVMETTFVSATGLKKADRWGKSDPYVQVYVNGILKIAVCITSNRQIPLLAKK